MTARGKKPKAWRAWCAFYEDATGPVVSSVSHGALTPFVRLAFTTRAHARLMNPGKRIARVEIREIPRKRKPTVARATDAASRVWWADVDRAAKSARVLRDKPRRKGKRT